MECAGESFDVQNVDWICPIGLAGGSSHVGIIVRRGRGNHTCELSTDDLIRLAESVPTLKSKLVGGFISAEEWTDLTKELSWRDKEHLAQSLLRPIRRKTRDWLILLLVLTSILMAIVFFFYFFILFRVLLDPSVISKWVSVPLHETQHAFLLFGRTMTFSIYSTDLSIIRVSLLLSVFVALAANVYSLTDSSAAERLTSWLRTKAHTWIALASLYEGVISPGYQIWRFIRRDKRRGLVNASIVVPRGSIDDEVQKACEHLERRLHRFQTLIHVTAYEEDPSAPVYETWVTGRRWQLLNVRSNGSRSFEPISVTDDDIPSRHFLGRESLESGSEIPEEWFGNDSLAVSISREIWTSDFDHEWVLHPNTLITETATFVDVALTKKMETSDHYKEFVKGILDLVMTKQPNASNVTITVSFRDTGNQLASVWWYSLLPHVTYSDEILGRRRYEKSGLWVSASEAITG